MRVLQDIPCNKLFLQDSLGDYGTYYMCKNFDFGVSDTIQTLIENVRNNCNIQKENCIFIGSSKGGTAALYHGIAGDYGHVICMGPQTKIVDFLDTQNSVHQTILLNMIGESPINDQKIFLNNLLIDTIKQRKCTTIHLLSSRNDDQFPVHIVPLLKELDVLVPINDVTIDDRIKSHSELSQYNPMFIRNKLFEIFLSVHKDFYLKKYEFLDNSISEYHCGCKYFVEKINDLDILNNLNFSYEVIINKNHIYAEIIPDKIIDNLLFAFYLYYENNKIISYPYTQSSQCNFSVDVPGKYRIKYYCKYREAYKSFYSKWITIVID